MNDFARIAANEARLLKRSCESLIGICSGLLADKYLSDDEIVFLDAWLADNDELAYTWPGEIVVARVREVLADGIITDDERDYLRQTLEQLVGNCFQETGATGGTATTLPLDDVEGVQIESQSFCFTGQFLFGTRAACHRATEKRGGVPKPRILKDLDYLVIGTMASREWASTSHGRKIEKAMQYKSKGREIQIIDEQLWTQALS